MTKKRPQQVPQPLPGPVRRTEAALELPAPSPSFRRRAWLDFQRALDPLAAPKPLRPPPPQRG